MTSPQPSIRSIARMVGLSKATVANALRGDTTVAPATARRVREAAAQVGYRRNPMVTTVMSAMRRLHGYAFHGVIACVDFAEPDRPDHGPFHRQLQLGAKARAEDLGFTLEAYVLGPENLPVARLDSILKSRGIEGLVLLPFWRPHDLARLDWGAYAAVSADYVIAPPYLHAVCCDHYRSILVLLHDLVARGYRRPGVFLEAGRDERVHLRMSAAFHAFQEGNPEIEAVPVRRAASITSAEFLPWFQRYRPDVVLSHHVEVLDMMKDAGCRVPSQAGFACLNLTKTTRAVAGLDQQPALIGARSVELLIAQLQRNERGLPECPSSLTLPAKVVDGPTLRRRPRTGSSNP